MKFEKPVAEVTKFDLKDILTGSTETTKDPAQEDLENRVGATTASFDPTYVCNGTARDMLGDPYNCAG